MKMKLFTRRFYKYFKTIESEFKGRPVKYMEIGVFLGDTAEWMIENVLTHPDSIYIGIDPWEWFKPFHKRFPTPESWQKKMLDRIDELRKRYKGKALFIKGFSHEVLRDNPYPFNSFDLIYIDGHHTIQSVLRDYVYSWPLLKINGVMIFDDYKQGHSDEVRCAVDTILIGLGEINRGAHSRGSKINVLWKDYSVGIRKLKE